MLSKLRRMFSAPTFQDEEKARVAGLLNMVLLFVIGSILAALPILTFATTPENVIPLLFVLLPYLLANILAYALMRRGHVRPASVIFLVVGGIAIFAAYAVSPQESIGSAIGFLILIAFGVLLLDARAVAQIILIIVLFTLAIAVARDNGWITPVFTKSETAISEWVSTTIVYFLTGIGLVLSSQSLQRALKQARASAQEVRVSNKELVKLRDELEKRVTERTAELEATSQQNEKRALDLQTISEIGRAISTEKGLEKLLPLIAHLVGDRFGFYHVGIFLVDPSDEVAVLVATNSAGGEKMLKRGYQIKVSGEHIVGYVTRTGTPRIALDLGEDSKFFNNPDLPESHSELALPLTVSGKIIGALDVQSRESAAISTEDVASLSILADQVSIAIENARLYEEIRKSYEQTESAFRQYVKNEWTRFVREENLAGFRFSDGNSTVLNTPLELGQVAQIVQEGSIHQTEPGSKGKPAELTVPVKIRGEVIGVLHIEASQKTRWTDDDIDIAEAVAERLAFSIENARLFQNSANRAARERIVSDISSKISGNTRVENILRLAAQELSQALNGSDVLIQLQKPVQPLEVQE